MVWLQTNADLLNDSQPLSKCSLKSSLTLWQVLFELNLLLFFFIIIISVGRVAPIRDFDKLFYS